MMICTTIVVSEFETLSQDSAVRRAPAKTGIIGARLSARPGGYNRPSSERSSKSDRSSRSTDSYSQDEQTSCEEPGNASTNKTAVGEDVIDIRRIVSVAQQDSDNSMQRPHDPAISLSMYTTTSMSHTGNDECLGRLSPGDPDHLGTSIEMSNPNSELDPVSYPTSAVTNEWGPMQSRNSSRRRRLGKSEAAERSNATVSLSSEREDYFSTTCKSYIICAMSNIL